MFSLGPIPARPGEASKEWLGVRPRWHAAALGASLGVGAFSAWHPGADRGPSLVGAPWGSLAVCGVVALLGTAAGAVPVAIVGWLVIRPFVVLLRATRREDGIPITVWCEEIISRSLLPLGIGVGMGSTHVDGGHPITSRDIHQLLVFMGFPVAGMQEHPVALRIGRVASVVMVGALVVHARQRRMARADHCSPG